MAARALGHGLARAEIHRIGHRDEKVVVARPDDEDAELAGHLERREVHRDGVDGEGVQEHEGHVELVRERRGELELGHGAIGEQLLADGPGVGAMHRRGGVRLLRRDDAGADEKLPEPRSGQRGHGRSLGITPPLQHRMGG